MNELKRISKEVGVVSFEVMFWHLIRRREEKHKILSSITSL
jgi:hypothetical protein